VWFELQCELFKSLRALTYGFSDSIHLNYIWLHAENVLQLENHRRWIACTSSHSTHTQLPTMRWFLHFPSIPVTHVTNSSQHRHLKDMQSWFICSFEGSSFNVVKLRINISRTNIHNCVITLNIYASSLRIVNQGYFLKPGFRFTKRQIWLHFSLVIV